MESTQAEVTTVKKRHYGFEEIYGEEDLHPDVFMSVLLGVEFRLGVIEVHASEVG